MFDFEEKLEYIWLEAKIFMKHALYTLRIMKESLHPDIRVSWGIHGSKIYCRRSERLLPMSPHEEISTPRRRRRRRRRGRSEPTIDLHPPPKLPVILNPCDIKPPRPDSLPPSPIHFEDAPDSDSDEEDDCALKIVEVEVWTPRCFNRTIFILGSLMYLLHFFVRLYHPIVLLILYYVGRRTARKELAEQVVREKLIIEESIGVQIYKWNGLGAQVFDEYVRAIMIESMMIIETIKFHRVVPFLTIKFYDADEWNDPVIALFEDIRPRTKLLAEIFTLMDTLAQFEDNCMFYCCHIYSDSGSDTGESDTNESDINEDYVFKIPLTND